MAVAIGCGERSAPSAPPAERVVRAAPGVRWNTLTARCPGRVQGQMDVDDGDVFRLDAACVVEVDAGDGARPLRWPAGPPGPVRCDRGGRCVPEP